MTTPSDTLQQYERIADITGRMLRKARNNHWQDVVELSQDYFQAVEHLKQINTLSYAERTARRDLLTRILQDDAEIRQLATPELQRLGICLAIPNASKMWCGPIAPLAIAHEPRTVVSR